ncbi:MAG TPA: phosphatase domain-containing protein [Candidatus Didemnitutus sp.]|nr:phosphatase domain-containing protein [Candidatus Didemnitutus sp.]
MAGSSSSPRLQTIVDDAWQGCSSYQFSGRVTKIRRTPQGDSGRLHSLYRNSRLLATAGRPDAVTWSVGAHSWTTRTDHHGYWSLVGSPSLNLRPGWHEIATQPSASSPAGLLVVDPRNDTGIISDLDDTILVTGVTSRRSFLRNSLLLPPEKRAAVPRMAQGYRRIVDALPNPAAAPVFYLSATPRQLTDNVRRFLALAGYPRGVLILKHVARGSADPVRDHAAYKSRRITEIFDSFPGVRFHLVGDDGGTDPEIYARFVRERPTQVADVWIQSVAKRRRPLPPGQRNAAELCA